MESRESGVERDDRERIDIPRDNEREMRVKLREYR